MFTESLHWDQYRSFNAFIYLGKFKGYGLCQFLSKCAGLQARHVLEGQDVRGHNIDCDWLDIGPHSLASLHSKVLYVDCLPPGYKDMGQFRKIFSQHVPPPYCQVQLT